MSIIMKERKQRRNTNKVVDISSETGENKIEDSSDKNEGRPKRSKRQIFMGNGLFKHDKNKNGNTCFLY